LRQSVREMKMNLSKQNDYMKEMTIDRMQKELDEEKLAQKWEQLNMGIEHWKSNYLFPFADIAPISEKEYLSGEKTRYETVLS
jgi:hypothetical protein